MPVYLIRQGILGSVKIGFAGDVVKRLRQLQTNQPVTLRIVRILDGGQAEEASLHRRFSARRLTGEWFSFCEEMVVGDLGLPDLPIPLVKKNGGRGFPDNAWGRQSALHQEILAAIGGHETLARRLRLPPWEVASGPLLKPKYFSATALLLVEAGRCDITLETLFEFQEAVERANEDIRKHNERIDHDRREQFSARQEADWIGKHGAAAAWWDLRPVEPVEALAQPEGRAA